MNGRIVIGACLVLCALQLPAVVLENDRIAVLFADAENGFSVTGIVHKTRGTGFLNDAPRSTSFWRAVFVDRSTMGSNAVAFTSNLQPACERKCRRGGDSLEFEWKGMDLPGEPGAFDVTARVSACAEGVEWEMSVCNRSGKFALETTGFPYFRGVVGDGEADVLLPHEGYGAKLHKAYSGAAAGTRTWGCPGYYTPFAAYNLGEAGLYVGAHDPACRYKSIAVNKDNDLWFETLVENAGVPRLAAEGPRFKVLTATYDGDWWQAAHIYRDWAMKQRWTAKGPIASRTDYPRRLSNTHVWIENGGTRSQVDPIFKRMERVWPDVGKGLEWAAWTRMPWDCNYPEQFPALDGVPDGMSNAVSRGFLVMPYTNGRLWDADLAGFRYARRDACQAADGTIPTHVFSGWRHATMCPAAKDWQAVLVENGCRIRDRLHVNSIYYDMVGYGTPWACYNASHGHPLGGGTWWADGYRSIFTRVHREFGGAGFPIVTEGTAETWLDVIDGYLTVSPPTPEDVPLCTALYSGYATYLGTLLRPSDPVDLFFAVSARAVVWGIVPGWLGHAGWAVAEDGPYRNRTEILHRLARIRKDYAEFFAYGFLEDTLRPLDRVDEVELDFGRYEGHRKIGSSFGRMPAVIATVWSNFKRDARAVAVANVSPVDRTIRFRVPFTLAKHTGLSCRDGVYSYSLPSRSVHVLRSR